ncbi:MAG TPA: hypothetical protein DCP90_07855 [Clostridiales bacterium]|nr:MAG: hypothetical protein A2Y22_06050 [Clostridiales bacterium GWD2_32_59]HAN10513.1 hypothetical protein [Clostridiales bacterium]
MSKGNNEEYEKNIRVIKWFEENKVKIIIILFLIGFVILLLVGISMPIIIHNAYSFGKVHPIIIMDFDEKDILTYWGSFLGFLGTLVFGALTAYLSFNANSTNKRLLLLEKNRDIYNTQPFVNIIGWRLCDGYAVTDLFLDLRLNNEEENRDYTIYIEIKNTSNVHLVANFTGIELYNNDKRDESKYIIDYGYWTDNPNIYIDVGDCKTIGLKCSSELIDSISRNNNVKINFILENNFGIKFKLIVQSKFLINKEPMSLSIYNLKYNIEYWNED